MHTIPEIKNFPDKTPVSAVQVKVSKAFPRKMIDTKFGQKSVQGGQIEDHAGNTMGIDVWEHPDITELVGKEVVIMCNGKDKGVEVKRESYTDKTTGQPKTAIKLSIGKGGTFQYVQVYHDMKGTSPAPVPANPSPSAAPAASTPAPAGRTAINGAKVGMAVNNAVLFMTHANEPFDAKRLTTIASDIIRVSEWLEAGNLTPKTGAAHPATNAAATATNATPVPTTPPPVTPPPATDNGADEDVPF